MGTLYLVATPIGNLEDITARAIRVLREVQLIAAEDTRHTRKLLSHFDIHTQLTSYFEHNKLAKLDTILAALADGDVALVSDAGTPALNDPGFELVRAALDAGYPVSPIPGPSAPVAALVASGLPTNYFLYLGYLPRKSGDRRQLMEQVRELPFTLVFLETPHRLVAALKDAKAVLGDRLGVVAREMTKVHEEFYRGSLTDLLEYYQENQPRGEIVLVISGAVITSDRWSDEQLEAALERALQTDESQSQAASRLAEVSGWPRRQIYQRLTSKRKNY